MPKHAPNLEFDEEPLPTAGRGKADPSIRLMEQSLMRSLAAKETSGDGLRSIALMAALSGHDRHVDMEFMANLLDDMATICLLTRDLELTGQLRKVLEKVAPAKVKILDDSVLEARVRLKNTRVHLIEQLKVMTECAVQGDPIQ